MIIIISGDKAPNSDSALTKSPHNINFIESWHLHEENKVARAPKISQSLISIKNNCSNVIYLKYHQSLSNHINTITCVQSCGPQKPAHLCVWGTNGQNGTNFIPLLSTNFDFYGEKTGEVLNNICGIKEKDRPGIVTSMRQGLSNRWSEDMSTGIGS